MPEKVYVIHNVVRRQHTRLKRQLAAGRHRFNQMVGGGDLRIPRGRSRPVGKSFIEKHLKELKEKIEAGMLEVKTPGGQLINLSTMKVAAPSPPKPMPDPPTDTAADDKNQGSPKPVYFEGKGISEDVKSPTLASEGIPEGTNPEAEASEAEPSESGRKKKTSKRRSTKK